MSSCVYHHRTNIPHDSSSLHHHSNRLLRTPPKKTVSHNIAPFVPSDNVSPTIFLRHRFNRPRQKNDRKKRKKRSLAAIPDNATTEVVPCRRLGREKNHLELLQTSLPSPFSRGNQSHDALLLDSFE